MDSHNFPNFDEAKATLPDESDEASCPPAFTDESLGLQLPTSTKTNCAMSRAGDGG